MGHIAVIPARGGSKRIARKNIKLFAGKPMIGYAIEAAQKSQLFEHIVVSTDDEEIEEIARSYGAETPFLRPKNLADDHTPTVPVIAHAAQACLNLGWNVDKICCIYPGVPLIDPLDIEKSLELLVASKRNSFSFPVAPYPSAIQRALKRADNGSVQSLHPEFVNTRTQDLEPAYYDAGQFYWGSVEAWMGDSAIHANGCAIILPEWRVVDIDTPEDWERAELVFKAQKAQSLP